MPGRASGEVMPTSSGSDAAAQETEKSQSAEAGQSPSVASRTSCSQFRLRRPKRTAWIRNADRCKLIRTFQEVMPGRTSGEVRPTPSGSEAASQEVSFLTSGSFTHQWKLVVFFLE
ncbi:hypothetical protein [Mesotoga sp.]|uniref:hypothetical protein n=1 Tax=Mesotoga sp. TaxID=2053577 RepID=UPI002BA0469B|nr:hypothetical protein [Mesotoga sp.]HRX66611.1 hypothetical protein [Mesotoga sp.]